MPTFYLTKPAANSPTSSSELRNQLNAFNDHCKPPSNNLNEVVSQSPEVARFRESYPGKTAPKDFATSKRLWHGELCVRSHNLFEVGNYFEPLPQVAR